MPAHKSIRGPLWLTLVAALVAAIVMSFFVFVQSGEATQVVNEHSYEPKIIGGTAVANRKYSLVAALLNTNKAHTAFQQQFCGGSLIDRDSVLTAAHCVTGTRGFPVSPRPLHITVGRTVLNSDQGQKRRVSRIYIHPRYNGDSATYDAAVLKLSSPVSGIAPIKLATSSQNYLERPGRKATVAGWGSTTARPACRPSFVSPVFANRMRQAQVPIVSDPGRISFIRIFAGSSALDTFTTHLDSWSRRAELLKTPARATAAGRYSSLGRLTTAPPAPSTPRSGSLVSVRGVGLNGIPECTLR